MKTDLQKDTVIINFGKSEILINSDNLDTKSKNVLQETIQNIRLSESNYPELNLKFYFPIKLIPKSDLQISLKTNPKSILKSLTLPIYAIWNKQQISFELIISIILKRFQIIKDFLYATFKDSDLLNLAFFTYEIPPTNFPFILPFFILEPKTDIENEEILLTQKKIFHDSFCLTDCPILRLYLSREQRNSTFNQFSAKQLSMHTHCLAKKCLSDSSIVETVRGKYYYFHYLQDGENDNGWGCAYRSLQTLISWYVAQGYAKINVPRIQEIQKALVELKDKPVSFIGSSDWIGAYEVMCCLNYFVKVFLALSYY